MDIRRSRHQAADQDRVRMRGGDLNMSTGSRSPTSRLWRHGDIAEEADNIVTISTPDPVTLSLLSRSLDSW